MVNIAVRGHVQTAPNPLLADPFFRRFFNVPQNPRQQEFRAAGSGVIVDADKGYVLTNNHVVKNADEITVTLRDRRTLRAKIIGRDPEADVAIIQISGDNLTALPVGDSAGLEVGDYVIAVGNPFGLGQTVTSGIVSALGRTGLGIEGYEDFIQTDASINPGNSGGALVNLHGQLIGINTAIVGPAGGNVGIGFAIPINMAVGIMKQLIAHGEIRRGLLGVRIQDLTPDIASALDLKLAGGALIAAVDDGSPADKAGLKPGDVIVAVDGKAVDSAARLRNRIGLAEVGVPLQITYYRERKKHRATVKLVPRKQAKIIGANVDSRLQGAVFGTVKTGADGLDKTTGAEVLGIEQGSPAWQAGLRQGDIVTGADRQPVTSPDDLAAIAAANKGVLLLRINRSGAALFLAVR